MKPEKDEILWIYKENSEALDVFISMTTQWIVGGMGSIIGMNYVALESVMRIMRVKKRDDCFWRVRVMERAALKLIAKRDKVKTEDGSTT